MGFLTTWAADGGRTPAAVARMATYALSGKAVGVTGSDHLKLVALGGTEFGLTAGSALIPAGDTGTRQWQTYVVGVDATTDDAVVSVPFPVSTARTLHAVVVIPDPEWPGAPEPEDPLTFRYAELRMLTTAQYNALTLPHYRVATVAIPANASTSHEATITDRRKVALPRRARFARAIEIANPENGESRNTYEDWPTDASIQVTVPEWATRAVVRADLGAILHTNAANVDGWLAVSLGGLTVAVRRYDEVWKGSTDRVDRWVAGEMDVRNMAGQTVNLRTRQRRINGNGYLRADTYSTVAFDVEWIEDV